MSAPQPASNGVDPEWLRQLPDDPDERIALRREMALSLRNARWTYAQIAATLTKRGLPCSAPTARLDVQHQRLAMATSDSIEELMGEQRSVVYDMQKALYPKMMAGNDKAATVILRGLEHIAKLRALYSPARMDPGVSEAEFAEQMVAVISAVRPETLKELLRGNRQAYEAIVAILGPEVIEGEVVPTLGGHITGGGGGHDAGRGAQRPSISTADSSPPAATDRVAPGPDAELRQRIRDLTSVPDPGAAGPPDGDGRGMAESARLPGADAGQPDAAELGNHPAAILSTPADPGDDGTGGRAHSQREAVAASLGDDGLYDDGDGWSNI